MIELTRRYRFPAAHVLCHDSLDEAENRRIFGKCANPAGHGHNYAVEVTVSGSIDPRTGALIPVDSLDRVFEQRVAQVYSHRMLNELPAFAKRVPTAENIARTIHEELEPGVRALGAARLARVRVVETSRNSAEYGEAR